MKMFRFLRRVFIILILLIIVFFIFRLVKPEATSRFVEKVKTIPTTISGRFHREKKPKLIINGDTTSTNSNFEIKDNSKNDEPNYEEYNPIITDENYNENYEITNNDYYVITDDKNDENDENKKTENTWEIKDTSRLDELNRELDKIMASWNNQSGWEGMSSNDNEDLWEIISWLVNEDNAIQITEITWNALPSGFVIIDVEQPYEPETQKQTTTQTTTTNTSNNSTTSNPNNNTQNDTKPKNTNTSSPRRQEWDCWKWLSVQDCEEFYNIFWNMNVN